MNDIFSNFNVSLILLFSRMSKQTKKKKKDGDKVTLAYFRPTMLQKVQILNKFKLWNCFLFGTHDSDGFTEREQRWKQMLTFVQGLGIPNCVKTPKALRKVFADWKYAYNLKVRREKATGSTPVTWNEAELIIREIVAGNRYHQEVVKVKTQLILECSLSNHHD